MWHMTFCSTVGFIAVRVLKLVKSHNMTPRDYMQRVFPIGERRPQQGGQGGGTGGRRQAGVTHRGCILGASDGWCSACATALPHSKRTCPPALLPVPACRRALRGQPVAQ
jgi:hypothetical protein